MIKRFDRDDVFIDVIIVVEEFGNFDKFVFTQISYNTRVYIDLNKFKSICQRYQNLISVINDIDKRESVSLSRHVIIKLKKEIGDLKGI